MQQHLDFAKQIAEKAGKIMSQNFMLGMAKEWKQDNTPLTVTDTVVNQLVIEEVKQRFPDHGVLGEESSFDTDKKFLWVVDPVDGTMSFSHGIPASVFSLALVKDGQPIVAVVKDPFSDRTYYASKGSGTFVNDQPLRVNDQSELGPQVFIDIAGRFSLKEFDVIKVLEILASKQVRVSKSFSAIFNALPVVTGQYAASIVLLEYPWDGAAIGLLTTEAGGKVTDLHGNDRRWNRYGDGFIVSNSLIHGQLIDILNLRRNG